MVYMYVDDINKFFMLFSEGGFFKAHLIFPREYPLRPPKMKFITDIWHPNSKSNVLVNYAISCMYFIASE